MGAVKSHGIAAVCTRITGLVEGGLGIVMGAYIPILEEIYKISLWMSLSYSIYLMVYNLRSQLQEGGSSRLPSIVN